MIIAGVQCQPQMLEALSYHILSLGWKNILHIAAQVVKFQVKQIPR
jgi:hypothetical protein